MLPVAEIHSYHSRYFAVIPVPPIKQHKQLFRYAQVKKKNVTYLSHQSRFGAMKALKFSSRSPQGGLKTKF